MDGVFFVFVRLVVVIGLFGGGGTYLKKYADFGLPQDLAVSLAAYLLGNLVFIEILRRGLGYGMVLSSMGQLILMLLVGALAFGERIGPVQGVGVVFALLAIAAFTYGAEAG